MPAKRGVANPKLAEVMRQKWADPTYRAQQARSRNTPEYRARQAKNRTGYRHDERSRARLSASKTTHGLTGHPLFQTWNNIRYRCFDERNKVYHCYGGRGITLCSEWRDDPAAFIDYVEVHLGPRPEGCSIDRIDNDGDYEPGNLRWATRSEQMRNRRPSSEWRRK